ncbi:MAG: hypothetical protein KDK34_01005, partial [Leptospiraceae bacterium]|nr:hypothetical protein [Leptospiraceae bacterium]
FAHIRRKQEIRDRVLEVEVILPERIRSVGVNLLDYEILPIASNYFFYYPALQNTRLVNHVTVLQRFATEIISSHVLREQSVTLTHFRFQDLSVYFERSGEHGTRDFMNGIIRTIRNNLKSTDTVYQMSPTSYVVFSPGAQKHHIQRRFKSIYFQIKSLVLEYKQFIVTIDSLPVNIEALWRELNL